MIGARFVSVASRAAATVLLLVVATYQLLASIPFAYYHFLQFPHFAWMPAVIAWHPAIFCAGALLLASTLTRVPALRRWRRIWWLITGSTAIWTIVTARVAPLQTFENASALCFATLVILAGAAAMNVVSRIESMERPSVNGAPAVALAVAAGSLTADLYIVRATLDPHFASHGTEFVVAAAASFLGHVTVFVLPVLVLAGIVKLARRGGLGAAATWGAVLSAATVFGAILIRRTILADLVLSDARADAVAALLALALVLAWSAERVAGVSPPTRRSAGLAAIAAIVALPAGVIVLPRLLAGADWGNTLHNGLVLVVWLSVSTIVVVAATAARRRAFAAAGVFLVIASAGLTLRAARDPGAAGERLRPAVDWSMMLGRYALVDPSMAVVVDLLRPTFTSSAFYDQLHTKADITYAARQGPVPLVLSRVAPEPRPGLPNIFMLVIDSLRPDYLGAYDPDVWFTPHIDAFARDALVFRRGFAAYTGTALSQPSIWAGGLVPRRQYPKPFAPLDNLERLLVGAGYREYISVDEILGLILSRPDRIERLDAEIVNPTKSEDAFKLDLCTTLEEFEAKLRQRRVDATPLFMYTQPQNLHVRVLDHAGRSGYELRAGAHEFFKPAVETLQKMDACFGTFIDVLRAEGLYDNSIIVLTSDHGDYLGDDGRWGHSTYTTPTIARVPIVMRVPERLLAGRHVDTGAVTLLTDITPTIYDLLGLAPDGPSPPLGRSVAPRADDRRPSPDVFLVQASYSRSFCLLDGAGRWFYEADANRMTDRLYDLREPGDPVLPLSEADRLAFRKRLMDEVDRFNGFFAGGR